MLSSHLILCRPLLLLPSIFPSIRVFSSESALPLRWPKHWSFSFGVSPSNEYSGVISFRMDWLDLLAVQGTLKSLVQHHSSKVSILLSFLYSPSSHICMNKPFPPVNMSLFSLIRLCPQTELKQVEENLSLSCNTIPPRASSAWLSGLIFSPAVSPQPFFALRIPPELGDYGWKQ